MQNKSMLNNAGKNPKYLQIYDRLKKNIIDADYPFGSRLPSRKIMAEEQNVSVITIKHAYDLLCDEGYIESKERSGYYVIFRKEDGFLSSAPNIKPVKWQTDYDKTSLFPFSVLAKTMRRVMSDYGDLILEKAPNKGCLEFRDAIRKYLSRNRNIHVDTDQIVVGSGSEYLYSLIVGLFGTDKTFALESPSYPKIEQVYHMAGVCCEFLPLGADGIESQALSKSSSNILHISPYRSFPSGVTASASKKHEYIRWASRPAHYIIEDDFESEFSLSSKPEETMFALSGNDNVIYMNTFSRTISHSLRMGYMVIPKCLVKTFDEKLGFYSCTVPTFEQLVIAELINNGDFERHINRIRKNMRREMNKQKGTP